MSRKLGNAVVHEASVDEEPMSRCLLAVTLIATLAGCASCRGSSSTSGVEVRTKAVSLALDPYFRELRTVRVESTTGPLTLLLDTGGGTTLVTPEVAVRGGCAPYGRDVGHRMSGEPVEFKRCDRWELRAPGWSASVDPIGVFDVNALLPGELPRLDGVLALDAFRGRVVTIDWPAARILVHPQTHTDGDVRSTHLSFRPATGDTGRFLSVLVPVEATRGRLWFLLDSGNIRGTLLSRHVVTEGLLPVAPDQTVSLAVDRRPAVRTRVEVADLATDGALGTAYLMAQPVTLDLRALRPGH